MADPYATQTPDLSRRPTGPPPWEGSVTDRGGALIGPAGEVPSGSFLVVPCRGMGTLAPFVRLDPPLATLLWLEHVASAPAGEVANGVLSGLGEAAVPIYAIKQGCVGGPSDRPGCFSIGPELIEAVLAASTEGAISWERDPDFAYDVPGRVPGLDSDSARALLPRLLYADHDRVYEHASLVAAKKRERLDLATAVGGLDPSVADAAGWPPVPSGSGWRD